MLQGFGSRCDRKYLISMRVNRKSTWMNRDGRRMPFNLSVFLFAAAIACFPATILQAQDGEPFMNHFKLENVPGNRITSIAEDLENTMIFSGSTGVITFDSEEWQIHPVPNIPMAVSSDSILPLIYVGGRGFFGYLLKTGTGMYEYHSLAQEGEETGDISRIYQTSRHVIYYGDDLIAIADRNELYNLKRFTPDTSNIFSGILIYRDNAYVNLLGKGIHEIDRGGLTQVESRIDFGGSEILFGIEYGDSNALLGLDNNSLYWFNGNDFSPVNLEDQEYLEESFLEDAAWLEKDVFALSTILGGCLIVDVVTGETINILNYRTGLPDDEIYAIGKDRNHGLWLSHQYGLTRVDVRLPVRSFENYPGLEGNLTAVAMLEGTLYVSTNEGIFYLEEKKDYVEEEVVIKLTTTPVPRREPKPEAEETIRTEPPAADTAVEETELSPRERRKLRREERKAARRMKNKPAESAVPESDTAISEPGTKDESPEPEATADDGITADAGTDATREQEAPDSTDKQKSGVLKSFFQRIGGRPKEDAEPEPEAEELTREEIPGSPVSRTRYIKQKIYSLQSITHEFTRLGDFEEKAKDLVPVGSRVLISTNGGLYEIVGREFRIIRKGWYVESIFPTRYSGRIYVVTDETAYQMVLSEGEWDIARDFSYIGQEIYSVCEEDDSTIWLGCDNRSYRISPLNNAISDVTSFDFHEQYYDPVIIRNIQDTVRFFLSSGIYCYQGDSIIKTSPPGEGSLSRIFLSTRTITWVQSGDRWTSYRNQENYDSKVDSYLNLFEDIADLFLDPDGNVWIVSGSSLLHKINLDKVEAYDPGFELFLKSVFSDERYYMLDQLQFDYSDRSLVFNLSAPFYLKDNSTSYQYFAEGMSEGWSEWSRSGELRFPVLPMGRFTLHVRARNVLNQVTGVSSFQVAIKPPWWLSVPFLVASGIILVLLVLLIVRWRVRKLKRDKAILEEKVKERTLEIQKQKDEISDQKKEIMDSIHYAQRIQKAVLPSDKKVEQNLPEHFILYLPRDIVSGDFYWISAVDNRVIFAAADCTGHGVPGAFMSMLGISFLNEIASKSRRLSAGRILDNLRENVKETLSQEEGGTSDGMDIALCVYDREKMTLQFAGAHNPLYLVRDGELTEFKADYMPIGIHIYEESSFKNHSIKVQPGDCIYLFSDGYADQFGGPEGKKFLTRSMKQMFTEVHSQPMPKQRELINQKLQEWMEGYEQVDDIIVMGVRI
jgi:serine phosphatase RsbU (regulator of sigma subunit)